MRSRAVSLPLACCAIPRPRLPLCEVGRGLGAITHQVRRAEGGDLRDDLRLLRADAVGGGRRQRHKRHGVDADVFALCRPFRGDGLGQGPGRQNNGPLARRFQRPSVEIDAEAAVGARCRVRGFVEPLGQARAVDPLRDADRVFGSAHAAQSPNRLLIAPPTPSAAPSTAPPTLSAAEPDDDSSPPPSEVSSGFSGLPARAKAQ
jgi:hypothetical protein